jgi:hypothetical protein
MSKNEVAKTTSTEVAEFTDADMAAWGKSEMTSKDIIIPYIILLQANGDHVKNGKGKGGDFYDAIAEKNLGPVLKGLIPFHMEKTWTVEKFNGKKWEWDHTEKMTPENESLPYEFEVGADIYRNKYTYRFYVLVEGSVLPYSIKMKGASKKTGQNLSTEMFVKNAMDRLPPAAKFINITSFLDKNKDGDSYFAMKLEVAAKTPHEKVMEALNWFKTLRDDKSVIVVDDKEAAHE